MCLCVGVGRLCSLASPVCRPSCVVLPSVLELYLLVWGGVGSDFEPVPSSMSCFVPAAGYRRFVASPGGGSGGDEAGGAGKGPAAREAPAPSARACHAMCADGLRAYVFGGFDGEKDRDELWCLSLLPPCFAAVRRPRVARPSSSRCSAGVPDRSCLVQLAEDLA